MLKEVIHMETIKSLDYLEVITALLCDVQTLHSSVFTTRALKLTLGKVKSRYTSEGMGFLTKSLPRLGKAFDKALAGVEPLNSTSWGFKSLPNSQLPQFMGELFQTVLSSDGNVLPAANAASVKELRQLLYFAYKLELPYSPKLEQDVIEKFLKTELDIRPMSQVLSEIANALCDDHPKRYSCIMPEWMRGTIRTARSSLQRLFRDFDPRNIFPRHGPGAVSTGEKLWDKYRWGIIPDRLSEHYPIDEYFFASSGHVCDAWRSMTSIANREPMARVCLVPKDSRGPRLISCEPLAFQWIQQGLSQAIVRLVESHPQTKWSVRFTDQGPNQRAALMGSKHGRYATLDLNEASDRVSIGLVRLLFPEPLLSALLASRSLGTTLPSGEEVILQKFAPMGSALCFPILALTVWSLLDAGLRQFDENLDGEEILVYGDDVIVPTYLAEHAMNILESVGLKINRDKSCTKGLFRESCGMDAYRGIPVTPVRFRTVWSPSRRPEVLSSYVAYANALIDRQYRRTYELIVGRLNTIYGAIPCASSWTNPPVPALREVPEGSPVPRTRVNHDYQRVEQLVWSVEPKSEIREIDGWSMLLRHFSEGNSSYESKRSDDDTNVRTHPVMGFVPDHVCHTGLPIFEEAFRVRKYTHRRQNKIRRRWR